MIHLTKYGEGQIGKLDCDYWILNLVGLNKALLYKGGNLLFGETSNMESLSEDDLELYDQMHEVISILNDDEVSHGKWTDSSGWRQY